MKSNAKYLPLIAILAAACNLSPKTGKIYNFKEVGWTMTLPPQFKVVDSAGVEKINEKGKALMEKSTGAQIDVSTTRTLISAKKGVCYFTSTITPYNTQKDGDYAVASKAVKDMVYKTFTDQMTDATLDSASDPTKVGGLDFDRFRISIAIKGKPVFTMYLLAKLYKGFDFGITYLYTDDQTKTQMENILAGSKFQ